MTTHDQRMALRAVPCRDLLVGLFLGASILEFLESIRGGSGNSDSVISGSLASPEPLASGEPEEHGDEENETESWGHV